MLGLTLFYGRPDAAYVFDVERALPYFAVGLEVRAEVGELYAFSEMADRASPRREFYAPSADLPPDKSSLEVCENFFNRVKKGGNATENYSALHLLRIRHLLGNGESDGAYWLPDSEHPVDGSTKEKSDMVTPLRPLGSGAPQPGDLRPLRAISLKEGEGE